MCKRSVIILVRYCSGLKKATSTIHCMVHIHVPFYVPILSYKPNPWHPAPSEYNIKVCLRFFITFECCLEPWEYLEDSWSRLVRVFSAISIQTPSPTLPTNLSDKSHNSGNTIARCLTNSSDFWCYSSLWEALDDSWLWLSQLFIAIPTEPPTQPSRNSFGLTRIVIDFQSSSGVFHCVWIDSDTEIASWMRTVDIISSCWK